MIDFKFKRTVFVVANCHNNWDQVPREQYSNERIALEMGHKQNEP